MFHPRKDTMTNLQPYASRLTTLPRAHSAHSLTIFLDRPSTQRTAGVPATRPSRSSLRAPTTPDAGAGNGILFGLAALTVPAVIYSLVQLAGLVGGGTLDHAVRAFLP